MPLTFTIFGFTIYDFAGVALISSSFYRLKSIGSHIFCKSFITGFFDHRDACCTVGFEYDRKYLRYEVVEFFAFHGICKILAISTTGIPVFYVARSDLTPGSFLVFSATGTGPGNISLTSTAVQTAVRNQGFTGCYRFHDELVFENIRIFSDLPG